MNKIWKHQVAALGLLSLGAITTSAGCESKGPVQKAGENIDKGVQDAKDAINPPGPSEKVGRAVDKVVNPKN